jgi:hypothetical protein
MARARSGAAVRRGSLTRIKAVCDPTESDAVMLALVASIQSN